MKYEQLRALSLAIIAEYLREHYRRTRLENSGQQLLTGPDGENCLDAQFEETEPGQYVEVVDNEPTEVISHWRGPLLLKNREEEDIPFLPLPDHLDAGPIPEEQVPESLPEPRPARNPEALMETLNTIRADRPFGAMLQELIIRRGLDNPEFQRRANMTSAQFHNLVSLNAQPKKKTVLSCLMGLSLRMEEAEALMKSAGYAFSNADLTDLIVRCFIEHGVYDIRELNDVLVNRYDLPALGYAPRE